MFILVFYIFSFEFIFKNLARPALIPRWPAPGDPGPPHWQEVAVPGAAAAGEAVPR